MTHVDSVMGNTPTLPKGDFPGGPATEMFSVSVIYSQKHYRWKVKAKAPHNGKGHFVLWGLENTPAAALTRAVKALEEIRATYEPALTVLPEEKAADATSVAVNSRAVHGNLEVRQTSFT